MKIIQVAQGSQEWLDHRATTNNASDAPTMMGFCYGNRTRQDLVEEVATGIRKPVTPHLQQLFDKGHAAEEAIRPHIVEMLSETVDMPELYPVVAVADDGAYPQMKNKLGASYDGLTMLETIAFEHKLWNAELAELVRKSRESGVCLLTGKHFWQLEQQIAASADNGGQCSIEKVIFVVSDGTPEKMEWMWYEPVQGRREELIAGWLQFEADVEAFKSSESLNMPAPNAIMDLPVVTYRMNGMAVASDFDVYRQQAGIMLERANRPMVEDQDFADGKKLVTVFEKAEKHLKARADEVIAQAVDINQFRADLLQMAETLRKARLDLDKRVESELKSRKQAIQDEAKAQISAFVAELESNLSGIRLQKIDDGIAASVKGKSNLDNYKGAANDAVAKAKIAYRQQADLAASNLKRLSEGASEFRFLFNDIQQIVFKPTDDFANLVNARISQHKAAEAAKLEAERERIRKEEEAKARAEMERQQRIQAEREADERKAVEAVKSTVNPAESIPEFRPVAVQSKERVPVMISRDLIARLQNLASIECPLQKLAIECLEDMGLEVPELETA